MNVLTDALYLRPKKLLVAERIELVDAINLVVYAKKPMKSALTGFDLVAGFTNDPSARQVRRLPDHERAHLRSTYPGFGEKLQFPLSQDDYESLYNRLLLDGADCLPHFYHEHHLLVDRRRRAAMFESEYKALTKDVATEQFVVQKSDNERTKRVTPSAWISHSTLLKYLEDRGVDPWWANPANIASHARLERILLSDAQLVPEEGAPEHYFESLSPSLALAETLLRRYPLGRRFAPTTDAEALENSDRIADAKMAKPPSRRNMVEEGTEKAATLVLNTSEPRNTEAMDPAQKSMVTTTANFHQASDRSEERNPARPSAATADSTSEYMSKEEIATLLGVHTNTVDNYRRQRQDFPKELKFGPTTLRWSRAEIYAWIREQNQR